MLNIEQPLISVIVPCYNYAAFLGECIGSLQAQTYPNWECIIIDDGSTDDTARIAKKLTEQDNRIHYVYQNNAGPAVARNKGLQIAKGLFIQFLDADDLIEAEKFEKQIDLVNTSCDIVYSNVQYFSNAAPARRYNHISLDDSPPWMLNLSGKGDTMVLALLKENIMVINSPLVRRELFEKYGGFDNTLFFNEDWELWLRFAMQGVRFCFSNPGNTQALVRVHSTSYSKDIFKMYIFGLKASLKVAKNFNSHKYKRILVPKIAYHQKIIDRELVKQLYVNKIIAIEMAELAYAQTAIKRYTFYTKLFMYAPLWLCKLYAQAVFLANKFKNTIIYA